MHTVRAFSLVFVLFFIGFYAQQLSVVNIYTLLLDIVDGFSLEVYLLDPVIFILWALYLSRCLLLVGTILWLALPLRSTSEMMGIWLKSSG